MKKILLLLTLFVAGVDNGVMAQDVMGDTKAENAAAPKFFFPAGDTYSFGKIKEGDTVVHKFVFENKGKEPLMIFNAQASCGCTVPRWPKRPIKSGETDTITVTFHAVGHTGPFNKDIFIQSNAPTEQGRFILHVQGDIVTEKK